MTEKMKKYRPVMMHQYVCTYQDHKKVSIEAETPQKAAALARVKRKSLYKDNLNIVLSTVEI